MAKAKFSIKKVGKNLKKVPLVVALPILFASFFLLGIYAGTAKDKLSSIFRIPPALLVSANEKISVRELKERLNNKNFTLINVHTPYEGEVVGTDTFVEYDGIVAARTQLPQDKNAEIVLYCKTGRMSSEALVTLKKLGYTNIKHLEGGMEAWERSGEKLLDLSDLPGKVLPEAGFSLPVSWGDIGPRLIALGVIDADKFENGLKPTDEQKKILREGGNIPISIDMKNGQFVVDMLWALGLAQKSIVYTEGPLGQEYAGRVGNFASTGGWSLARGDAVNYLNKFDLIPLTSEQQRRVGEIAKGVYRPCCGNSTWFPDCNHGMAALAAIELMVSKGLSDEEIYKEVLKLNSFWFPDTYLTTATYFARQGISWEDVSAKEALGEAYSSAKGAADIYAKVGPVQFKGGAGGSCGA
ncbi:hypothetical protein A2129_00190 [Candidatus Woesebacteria bacterium GWC1_42_13]|uniref:Rhodanese domain-containing protein n=1 Tax=Candidatus Woesebacteria bacterium GWC1_42_13 TaxID=1802475 RepID=A0A1F7WXP7_9BACT|nr:MAG: hypothetical protein A2129_00190 [Candidatus Woesebacteria bacterium GWC1_42_13]